MSSLPEKIKRTIIQAEKYFAVISAFDSEKDISSQVKGIMKFLRLLKKVLQRILWLFHNLICTIAILLTYTLTLIHLKVQLDFSFIVFILLELLFSVPVIATAIFSKEFKLARFTYPIFYFLISSLNGDDTAPSGKPDFPPKASFYVIMAILSYFAFLFTVFTVAWYPIAIITAYSIFTYLFLDALPEEKKTIPSEKNNDKQVNT